MDDSILTYLNLNSKNIAFQYIKNIIDSCKSVNGTFSLLWHNSNLDNSNKIDLYLKILDYCNQIKNKN